MFVSLICFSKGLENVDWDWLIEKVIYSMYICTSIHVYTYVYIYTHPYMYIYIYVHIYIIIIDELRNLNSNIVGVFRETSPSKHVNFLRHVELYL